MVGHKYAYIILLSWFMPNLVRYSGIEVIRYNIIIHYSFVRRGSLVNLLWGNDHLIINHLTITGHSLWVHHPLIIHRWSYVNLGHPWTINILESLILTHWSDICWDINHFIGQSWVVDYSWIDNRRLFVER